MEDDHHFGFVLGTKRLKDFLESCGILGIPRTGRHWNVHRVSLPLTLSDLPSEARAGVKGVRILMEGYIEHTRVRVEDFFGSIATMGIEVEDEHPFNPSLLSPKPQQWPRY